MTPSERIAKIRELLNSVGASQEFVNRHVSICEKTQQEISEALSLLDGLERKEVVITDEDCVLEGNGTQEDIFRCPDCGETCIEKSVSYCCNCGAHITWQLSEPMNGESA